MAVGHRLAAPDPPGATPGLPDAPNGSISRRRDQTAHEASKRRPQVGLTAAAAAAERAACAPHTPLTLPAMERPEPAATTTVRRPLRPLPTARQPPRPAFSAHCSSAATVLRPAPTRQTARGELPATRTRGLGSAAAAATTYGHTTVPQRHRTDTHAAHFACVAHLMNLAAAGCRNVDGGGDGAGSDAHDVARHTEAASALRNAHRGTYEHRSSHMVREQLARRGGKGASSGCVAGIAQLCRCRGSARSGSSSGGRPHCRKNTPAVARGRPQATAGWSEIMHDGHAHAPRPLHTLKVCTAAAACAHHLGIKEWIIGELQTSSDARQSTHLWHSSRIHSVNQRAMFEGPDNTR